jgi:hypothetical protein
LVIAGILGAVQGGYKMGHLYRCFMCRALAYPFSFVGHPVEPFHLVIADEKSCRAGIGDLECVLFI